VSRNHFLTIYRPFSPIYGEADPMEKAGFAAPKPFPRALAPLKMVKMAAARLI
jgi:hypothetical protein